MPPLASPGFPPALQALIGCVGDDDDAFAAALSAAVAAGADPVQAALTHGLAIRLYHRVRQADLSGRLPAAQWEALKSRYLREARRQEALLAQAAEVAQLLQEAGVAFLALALLAVFPYALAIPRTSALLGSVALSLAALFALGSRVFIPRNFKPRAGIESALVGGVAGGLLFVVGLLVSRI